MQKGTSFSEVFPWWVAGGAVWKCSQPTAVWSAILVLEQLKGGVRPLAQSFLPGVVLFRVLLDCSILVHLTMTMGYVLKAEQLFVGTEVIRNQIEVTLGKLKSS